MRRFASSCFLYFSERKKAHVPLSCWKTARFALKFFTRPNRTAARSCCCAWNWREATCSFYKLLVASSSCTTIIVVLSARHSEKASRFAFCPNL